MLDVTQMYFTCDMNIYEESQEDYAETAVTSMDIDKLFKTRFQKTLVIITFAMWKVASITKSQLFMIRKSKLLNGPN